MTIQINGMNIQNKNDFYQELRNQLDLPDYFGNNLDALYDLLTEGEADLTVEFINYERLETALGSRFLHQLKRMLKDARVETRRYYDEHKEA